MGLRTDNSVPATTSTATPTTFSYYCSCPQPTLLREVQCPREDLHRERVHGWVYHAVIEKRSSSGISAVLFDVHHTIECNMRFNAVYGDLLLPRATAESATLASATPELRSCEQASAPVFCRRFTSEAR